MLDRRRQRRTRKTWYLGCGKLFERRMSLANQRACPRLPKEDAWPKAVASKQHSFVMFALIHMTLAKDNIGFAVKPKMEAPTASVNIAMKTIAIVAIKIQKMKMEITMKTNSRSHEHDHIIVNEDEINRTQN